MKSSDAVIVYAASPDDPLDAETAATLLGISLDSAYDLVRLIPSYKVPGVGVRFRRADVLAYLYRQEHRRDPRTIAHRGRAHRSGMRRASGDREEVAPGMTREELKNRAGF